MLPGAEVSEAAFGFGLLGGGGGGGAGGWTAVVFSSRAFSETDEPEREHSRGPTGGDQLVLTGVLQVHRHIDRWASA